MIEKGSKTWCATLYNDYVCIMPISIKSESLTGEQGWGLSGVSEENVDGMNNTDMKLQPHQKQPCPQHPQIGRHLSGNSQRCSLHYMCIWDALEKDPWDRCRSDIVSLNMGLRFLWPVGAGRPDCRYWPSGNGIVGCRAVRWDHDYEQLLVVAPTWLPLSSSG